MQLLEMNDDCLEHVIRFVDLQSVCSISDTCKHLMRIAERIFRRHRQYECHIGDEESVKNAYKIIRKIGPYVRVLHLAFDTIDPEVYSENGIGCRFLSLLNSSLGDKFCELKLSGEISSFPVLRLAPSLIKLEKLSIYCEIGEDDRECVTVSIDLPQLCPNLRALIIENCAVVFAPNPIKSFRNLEVLEFHSFGKYYPTDSFECFIRQNKDLKKLYVDNLLNDLTDEYIDMAVVANLKDLQELRIRTVVFKNWVQAIRDCTELHHLTTLAMSEYLDTVEELNDILDILKTMKQLKKIHIGWCFPDLIPNQQAIVNVTSELKQLESFQIDVKCDENTILECIRFGLRLKQFCVEFSKVAVTPAFIKHLARVREYVADASQQPLLLYFENAKLNGDALMVLKEPGVAQFLEWKFMDCIGSDLFERYSK